MELTVTVDWIELHRLTERAAWFMPSWPPVFGGTHQYCHVQETPFGLAQLFNRASLAIHIAWDGVKELAGAGQRMVKPQDELRHRLNLALAAGRLHRAVTVALGGEPRTEVICYTNDGYLLVQGVWWAYGSKRDPGKVPMTAVLKFLDGASLAEVLDGEEMPEPDTRELY